MTFVLGIALLVGGMAVSIGAPADARDARVLADRGVETVATVSGVTTHSHGTGSTHSHADVEFDDELGLPQEGRDIAYCGEPDALGVGDRVEIVYDPEGMAPPRFSECPQSQEITIPLVIGVAALAGGTAAVLRAWRACGWKRRWIGIPFVILGILFVGTSFEDDCGCDELVYTGMALVVIGTVPLVWPRRPEEPWPPGGRDASAPER
jgi:hypothetical protein